MILVLDKTFIALGLGNGFRIGGAFKVFSFLYGVALTYYVLLIVLHFVGCICIWSPLSR